MIDETLGDTIIAISTPPGYGGIGIVRLSGRDSLKIARTFFQPKTGKSKILPRQAILGNLLNPASNEAFDEAYLIYFQSPRSYTSENVVEISCHGGPAVLEEAVRLGISAGARHARAGEFTLRAYLNGRLDIIQAEAVNDLIRAGSAQAARLAFRQLDGRLSNKIGDIRTGLLDLLAKIEADIEFPEERPGFEAQTAGADLDRICGAVAELVSSYETGCALMEGVALAITGRRNVGKSTLFNALLGDERAIVTPYPGTTRDYLKEKIKIKDVYFNLVDMAGFGKAGSSIEREGMKRGKNIATRAAGLLILVDASKKADSEDLVILEEFCGKKTLLLFNKIDLSRKLDISGFKKHHKNIPALEISALKGTNLGRLKSKIYELFAPKPDNREPLIFHLRQKLLLEDVLKRLLKGRELRAKGYAEEIWAEEIRGALPFFGRLTGEIRAEDVMERIFDRFCIGK